MIGRLVKMLKQAVNWSFNSTMGWLEDLSNILGYTSGGRFQFHYGMIGSSPFFGGMIFSGLFQFHYGMIGRITANGMYGLTDGFQFHYGMIGSFCNEISYVAGSVSIPLWDDWKCIKDVVKRKYVRLFQFHYGMIGSFARYTWSYY